MNRNNRGFTFIELMVALAIMAILMAIATFGFKNYEARYRCQSAAQMLAMDIRIQQQRARRLDMEQGVYFFDCYHYILGTTNNQGIGFFQQSVPLRRVDLRQQFYGVSISSIGGSTTFPAYISFDPRAEGGGNWMPFSGFKGDIVIQGNARTVTLTVKDNREIDIVTH